MLRAVGGLDGRCFRRTVGAIGARAGLTQTRGISTPNERGALLLTATPVPNGATRLVNIFRNLDQSIRVSDWQAAAAESHRPQVSAARNLYVRQLFLSAAGVLPACIPTC